MNTELTTAGANRRLGQIAMLGGVTLLLLAAAFIWGTPLQGETKLALREVARYDTLAGVAGVRQADRDMNVGRSAEARYTTLSGVAAVRALDADRAVARPAASSQRLHSVAEIRAVDRTMGLVDSRLNLSGVAAVRAIDTASERSALPAGWTDPHLWRHAAPQTGLNLNGVAAVRALDQ